MAATGSGASPSGPARTVSAAAPMSAATALYGPGWTMSALGQQDVADHRPADGGQGADEDDRRAGQVRQLGLLGADHGEQPQRGGVQDDEQAGQP
jgi:hypothetical protein